MQSQAHASTSWDAACLALISEGIDGSPTAFDARLTTTPPTTPVKAQIAPSCVPPVEPAPKKKELDLQNLNQIFEEHRKLTSAINELVSQHHALENALFGNTLLERVTISNELELAHSAIKKLHWAAQERYAPPGGTLEIDLNHALRAVKMHDWQDDYSRAKHSMRREEAKKPIHIEQFADLNKLHAHFEKKYGGDAGKTAGLKQAARELVSYFSLGNGKPVNRVKGNIVLSTRVYSSKKDYGSNKGMFEPGSNGYITKAMKAMDTFLTHANDGIQLAKPMLHSEICQYGFAFTPREKRVINGIELTFFKERWDFRFDSALGQKLMLFIGEFGQEE